MKRGCLIYFFLISANLKGRDMYISKYFRESWTSRYRKWTVCSVYSLEVHHQGASDEYSHHMFHGEIRKISEVKIPVVQSIVSLTSSLRVISLTVLADSIHNILIFFAEKNVSSFCTAKATHIFSAKNYSIFTYHSM